MSLGLQDKGRPRQQLSNDLEMEAFLDDALGYDSHHEADGIFSIWAVDESEAEGISERVSSALSEHIEDFVFSALEWMVEPWPLEGVRWSDFGEEEPIDADGVPYPYAVVVACPWRLGGTEDFEDLVDRLLEDYGVEGERVGDRKWRVEYADEGANPAALVEGLKRTLGWWESYGLEFVVERTCASVTLEIKS